MKTGFVYEFLRVTLIRPAATGLRDPDALLDWFNRRKQNPDGVETPKAEEIFNGGQGYVNFIYL